MEYLHNRGRPGQGASESGNKCAYRDQAKGDKIAQVPWGEVFQSLEIHPEEFGLFPENTGKPWKVFSIAET